jgi:glycosyltransferase involved in cell wall biosynthesis
MPPELKPALKHLLLTTTEDPFNPKAWSGIPYSLREALERQVDKVSVFCPPPPRRAPIDAAKRVIFGAKKFPLWITQATLKQNARTLQAEIASVKPDAVLSISSQMVAYLESPGVPVFMFSDAPYWAFCETYAQWETPPLRIHKFAAEEARAGRRLDGLCFGSDWACAEAHRLYELPSVDTLHVTPLGANWVPKLTQAEIFQRIEARIASLPSDGIELLYLGKDWERKGGPLAVEVSSQIHASGRKVRLHVVGCRPELGAAAGPEGFVTVHGPLYQSDPEQSAKLAELFLRSHFLIVPTLAECFGIVFAEAQAFGLPPISRAVHAVPSIICDGANGDQTGMLFDRHAPSADYTQRVLTLLDNPEAYRAMAQQARLRFEQRLTWDRTAEAIIAAIRATLSQTSI